MYKFISTVRLREKFLKIKETFVDIGSKKKLFWIIKVFFYSKNFIQCEKIIFLNERNFL